VTSVIIKSNVFEKEDNFIACAFVSCLRKVIEFIY